MTPAERIKAFLVEFIQPTLHEQGFKFFPAKFSFKKSLGDFEQEIRFSRSKWNTSDTIVEFAAHLKVSSKTYKKWYKQEYQLAIQNDIIYASPANYIPKWNRELQVGGWYDLVAVDNRKIGKILINNIHNSGIPFLNALSTWQTAIDFIIKQQIFYLTPQLYDFCKIIDDKEQASKVLKWFDDFRSSTNANFMLGTIKAVEIRKDKLKEWA